MPRIPKKQLKWRERQAPRAIMKPSTFAKIEREAKAGGAKNPEAVAGKAYWQTMKARYAASHGGKKR